MRVVLLTRHGPTREQKLSSLSCTKLQPPRTNFHERLDQPIRLQNYKNDSSTSFYIFNQPDMGFGPASAFQMPIYFIVILVMHMRTSSYPLLPTCSHGKR
ncbi:hypothetical protein TNCV_4588651 [Trichonephila clavipes]|nr:hypothetical protein TNCV_4588651 [Trichonephila clavipes]